MIKPEYVSPGVVFLASEDAPTGTILVAGAGVFSASQMVETDGVNLGHKANADTVAANWSKITDFSTAKPYFQGNDQGAHLFKKVEEPPVAG
jgi:hypothetical protein